MSTRTPNLSLVKPDLTDPADITVLNENWNKIDSAFGKLQSPQCVPYTLQASLWQGSTAPYTYTIEGYTTENIEVVEDVNMTLTQLEVIENAKIKSDPSSENNVLFAFGVKPTIDVPVMLIVR